MQIQIQTTVEIILNLKERKNKIILIIAYSSLKEIRKYIMKPMLTLMAIQWECCYLGIIECKEDMHGCLVDLIQ